jgi:hypothetical protein
LDAEGLTLACATRTEASVGRRRGLRTEIVGLAASRGIPDGRLVSFGVAGALHEGLACGDVIDATRVVDEDGATLWEGGPLGAAGARPGTIVTARLVVDGIAERRRLHERTRADAVDMESGALARSGRLVGVVRAISDTPSRPLGPLGSALRPDGGLDWPQLARAVAQPRTTGRAFLGIKRALRRLGEAVAA